MPYTTNADLPKAVRDKLKGKKLRQWRHIFNSMIDNGSSEAQAFSGAWSAVKKPKVAKAQMAADVFTTQPEAASRSVDLGLDGATHMVQDPMGQVYFMPGEDAEDYMSSYDAPFTESENVANRDNVKLNWNLGPEAASALPDANKEYWDKMATIWNVSPQEARRQLCANCEYFNDSPDAMKYMETVPTDNYDVDGGGRGFCSKFDFICHNLRTCQAWEELEQDDMNESEPMEKSIEGKIFKSNDEQRLVYGWASVITEKGVPVVDRQGDVIDADTLVKAVSDFMEHVRVGKAMHSGEQVGVVLHSMPITKEIGASLGIQSDREGWLVAYKVYDEQVWQDVKSGKLAAFSIGGRATREEI